MTEALTQEKVLCFGKITAVCGIQLLRKSMNIKFRKFEIYISLVDLAIFYLLLF